MNKKEISRAVNEFLTTFIESREGFIWEATESVSWWDDRDERALVLGSANPHVSEPTMSVVFHCSKQLDPKSPPVTDWIEECLAAARGALPELHAELRSVDYLCTRVTRHMKAP